jgi:hypothetical protein
MRKLLQLGVAIAVIAGAYVVYAPASTPSVATPESLFVSQKAIPAVAEDLRPVELTDWRETRRPRPPVLSPGGL